MNLSFAETGSPSDSPLLFMHGLGASRQQIVSTLTMLDRTRLITPDMPGHGDSLNFNPSQFSFDYFADLTIALLDKLEIESTDVGGLSMGSGIALNLALRYPERVKKLIVLRPSWLDEVEPKHLALVARVGQWIDEDGEDFATQKLALDPDYQTLTEQNMPVASSLTALLDRRKDPVSTQVLFQMWKSRPFKSLSDLGRLPNQALVLDTSRDELHPQEVASAVAQALTHSQTLTLPPRYHEGKAYQKALNEALNDFLGR